MKQLRAAALLGSDLARIVGETMADGVVWAAVTAAEQCRRRGWLSDWLN